jgi:hypothetical protein
MPRCPFCKKILSDDWIKHEGAALMGKASGQSKARSRAQAKAASRIRWDQEREKNFSELRTMAGIPPPKKKRRT